MKIIKNWKQTLTAYSTVALGIIVGIPAVWNGVPPEVKALIPPDTMTVLAAIVATAGFIGRFIDQGHDPENGPENAQ